MKKSLDEIRKFANDYIIDFPAYHEFAITLYEYAGEDVIPILRDLYAEVRSMVDHAIAKEMQSEEEIDRYLETIASTSNGLFPFYKLLDPALILFENNRTTADKKVSSLSSEILSRATEYVTGGYCTFDQWYLEMKSYIDNDVLKDMPISRIQLRELVLRFWNAPASGKQGKSIRQYASEVAKRKERVSRLSELDRLYKQLDMYRNSDFLKDMVQFATRFKEYSPYNAMLLKTQLPGARYVLSAAQWKSRYNRQPKINARPLITLYKFGPIAYNFEISDTEPISQTCREDRDIVDDILEHLEKPFATEGNVKVKDYENLVKNLPYWGIKKTYFRAGSLLGAQIRRYDSTQFVKELHTDIESKFLLSVNDKADMSEEFASICHELGHLFCRHLIAPGEGRKKWWTVRSGLPLNVREFEADLASYIVCERFGVGRRSWEYLACYLNPDGSVPVFSVERVFRAADIIERMVTSSENPKLGFMYMHDKAFKSAADKYFKHMESPEGTQPGE